MKRRWLVLVLVAVVVAAAAVLVWVRERSGPDSRLAAAMALAPRTAVRFSWTDWAGVRRKLGISPDEASAHVGQFLSRAFDADLSSESALVDSAPTLQAKLGLSPATLDWELYSQGTDGAVLIMRLPDGFDVDRLRDTLDRLGYSKPASSDGVWGDAEGLNSIGELTPELSYLTIDEGDHVLAASDSSAFLSAWRSHGRGAADDHDPIDRVVASIGDATSASVYDGDFACQALAMSQADGSDQAEGARLVAEAGRVNPMDAFAIADEPDGDGRVAMAFESAAQARVNADTRAKLAAGPAPGQGGSFGDRFELLRTEADGDVVVMTVRPRAGAYFLSDLSTGPLLFATC